MRNSFLSCFTTCILATSCATADVKSIEKLPILYVYTVVPANCKKGLPAYIKVSLRQAIISQPDCDIIMASNYAECHTIEKSVDEIVGVKKIDVTKIASPRTLEFINTSKTVWDYGGELWTTSAQRLFSMEDIMVKYGYQEIMHVEADNLLYGKITDILHILRSGYPGLAATPLNDNVSFITASVLWIASLAALRKFNDFLLGLGRNSNKEMDGYLTWLRPYGCCKKWGINPDANGNGIKPFAVNEMSMLSYYRHLHPKDFYLLPVVPTHKYTTNRHVCNMSAFGPQGHLVGPATRAGIWDPNSWGQYLGGTSLKRGRDRGFTDSSHIAGQAMRTSGCKPKMLCSNETIAFPPVPGLGLGLAGLVSTTATGSVFSGGTALTTGSNSHSAGSSSSGTGSSSTSSSVIAGSGSSASTNSNTSHTTTTSGRYCYTAPYVRCAEDAPWTPLWNLHVHSKHTIDYLSQPCTCQLFD